MQLIKKKHRKQKVRKVKKPALQFCPQKRGHCDAFFIKTPKKPNSAKRKCVRVILSTLRKIQCYLPGAGYTLQKYSTLLIRGGRRRDLPGLKYTAIRGVNKERYAFQSLQNKKTARSKYGIKKLKKC